jgi:hypothetical protein
VIKARTWFTLLLLSFGTLAATVSCGSDEATGGGGGTDCSALVARALVPGQSVARAPARLATRGRSASWVRCVRSTATAALASRA